MKTDNELIAEFMALSWKNGFNEPFYLKDHYWIAVSKLKYHTSWDWLIQVVEKIESLGFQVHIWNDATLIKLSFKYKSRFKGWHQIGNINDKGKLASSYKAVVYFIKWYNLQQTKIK